MTRRPSGLQPRSSEKRRVSVANEGYAGPLPHFVSGILGSYFGGYRRALVDPRRALPCRAWRPARETSVSPTSGARALARRTLRSKAEREEAKSGHSLFVRGSIRFSLHVRFVTSSRSGFCTPFCLSSILDFRCSFTFRTSSIAAFSGHRHHRRRALLRKRRRSYRLLHRVDWRQRTRSISPLTSKQGIAIARAHSRCAYCGNRSRDYRA